MNWDKFIVHNNSYENAFETLCNQLFENWIKENYSELLMDRVEMEELNLMRL